MTNAELNEAVARKLKGWTSNCKCKYPIESAHHSCPGEFGNCHHSDQCNLPAYSTSIEAAWEILEALKTPFSMHIYRMTNFEYRCVLQPTDIQARADTAPLAIVKCFLKLPEIKNG